MMTFSETRLGGELSRIIVGICVAAAAVSGCPPAAVAAVDACAVAVVVVPADVEAPFEHAVAAAATITAPWATLHLMPGPFRCMIMRRYARIRGYSAPPPGGRAGPIRSCDQSVFPAGPAPGP